uniref:S100/CaBP-9k-type calcium binding subdomain domain-containing protein n=1 Tax=Neogobius melanostomus TaxID=47308 RepID=A0A8C6TQT5_9GOBI
METAIGELVSKFKLYAGKEGSSSTLSRDEFHQLYKSIPVSVRNSAVEFSSLANNDGQLNFLEFWQLIGQVADKHGRLNQ